MVKKDYNVEFVSYYRIYLYRKKENKVIQSDQFIIMESQC